MGLGWVCGRGFCGWVFRKGALLEYFDGFLLERANGCELRSSDGVSIKNSK